MQRRRGAADGRAGRPAVGGFVGRLEIAGFAAGHARWGGTLPTISHAIRLSELSTIPTNAAIPTMRMCDATERRGNCMRHSQIAHQAAARQCPGTVNAVAANDPPKPHRDGPRGHTQARDDTTTFSTVFPAPASWKRATQPPLFAYPPRWRSPPSTATFPRQQAEKSPQNQHVLSFNSPSACRRSSRRFRVCSCDWVRCTRSVGITPLLFGCSAT